MEHTTKYLKDGIWYTTYKFKRGGEILVLIKDEKGRPSSYIRFDRASGKMKKPSELSDEQINELNNRDKFLTRLPAATRTGRKICPTNFKPMNKISDAHISGYIQGVNDFLDLITASHGDAIAIDLIDIANQLPLIKSQGGFLVSGKYRKNDVSGLKIIFKRIEKPATKPDRIA